MTTTQNTKNTTVPGRFDGMKIVITGAGSGIGLATALRIAREGGRVIAADLDAARLAVLTKVHPDLPIATVAADITTDEGISAIVQQAGGSLDGLVNNAGIIDGWAPLGETDDANWRRVMAVNLDAPFRLTRALLPLLLKSPVASVVNVASEAALRGSACGTAYTTSKHAIVGMTHSAAFFYGPQGVRFNAVAPGAVKTNIEGRTISEWGFKRVMEVGSVATPPPTEPERLAAPICYLLSRDSADVNGTVLQANVSWAVV